MKKLFSIIAIMIISFQSFAQTVQDTVKVPEGTVIEYQPTISEAERLVDKYADKAWGAIEAIASALKIPAEHVYAVLVKQSFAEGLATILFVIMGLLLTSFLGNKAFKLYRNDETSKDFEGLIVTYTVISVVIGTISIIGAMFTVPEPTVKVINPEYYAIKEIMDFFKAGK